MQFLETGTRADLPAVHRRRRIHPHGSAPRRFAPLAPTSADLPPNKLTTETTSNVMVKDGHTIVIGGLFRETGQTVRSQIPVLGNLPWIGPLFRRQEDTTAREEVIVLLTPHIIKDDQSYSDASLAEMKYAERMRVGVRMGMMPWGRQRLAETAYEAAQAELNKPQPNRQKALWHLNCAINLNPHFNEAIELKEKLTGSVVTMSDNSSIRDFVRQQILADPARPTPKLISTPITPTSPAAPVSPIAPAPTTVPTMAPTAQSTARPAAPPAAISKSNPAAQPVPVDASIEDGLDWMFNSPSDGSSK